MPEIKTSAIDTFFSALDAVVGQAWPEVSGKFFRDTSIERENWVNLIQKQSLAAPWAVVKLTFGPSNDWGTFPKIAVTAEVMYIDNIQGGINRANANGEIASISAWLTQKIYTLVNAVLSSSTLGTITDDYSIQNNADLPANMSLIENDLSYQAASFTFTSTAVPLF